MTNRQEIEQAIAALESQRPILGADVVETSLMALHQQLAELEQQEFPGSPHRAERKQVTVMFADISGFTAMSEKLDPEEVRSMINACFERLGEAIDRYGGHIDKFIGDEIMALFGAPVAHENDPERALRAALDMMLALEAFNQEHAEQIPKPLALHFGINSGLVIAGGIGTRQRQDYSVMGDAVNLAARLEDLSETGEILVGENTYRLTAPLFEFEAVKPVKVKGKAQPVRVYRLLKAKKTVPAGQVRGIEGLYSPLVGRVEEFAQLRRTLDQFHQGQGGVVSVLGDVGLGKSRLVRELYLVCAQDGRAGWSEGRALSYGESASYLVARDVMCSILGLEHDASAAKSELTLRAAVDQLFSSQAAEIYPYLAYLLELNLDEDAAQRIKYLAGEALHQRVLQAVQRYIRAKTEQTPLVLVWEDLHWADPSSLALLEALLSLARECPLLHVLIYRYPVEGGRVWEFEQRVKHNLNGGHLAIDLPPLTPAESRQLLENLLGVGALPDPIREMIIAKAEGNPFYLEEVIRSLIDNGTVTRSADNKGWIAAPGLDKIRLPDSLQGVIMARIDQLAPATKRTLQVASVIGRNFLYEVLARVMDIDMANLMETLNDLEKLDLILLQKSDPDLEYAFKHVFTQESVYDSLLLSDRRRLHQHIGEVLEDMLASELDENENALLLAHHFEQSGDRQRALKYLGQAAAGASKSYANQEAKTLYQRALALLKAEDYAERWDILAGQEHILDRLGEREQQADTLTQMQTLAGLLADEARLATTHNRRAIYFDKISEYQASAEAAEVGLSIARRSSNEHLQAQSLNLLALAAWRRFDYNQVQEWALQALEVLKIVGDLATRITSLFHLGRASYRLGQYDMALHYIQAARDLTRDMDNQEGAATSHLILGWIYQRLGDYEAAAGQFLAKLKIRRIIGDRYGEATALSHLGWLAYDQRNPQAGLEYCHQALVISYDINDRENEAYALSGMGLNYEQQGQLDLARANYQAALAIHQDIGATTLAIFDQAGLARIALDQNNLSAARDYITPVANWVLGGNAQKFWDPWTIYQSSFRALTALGEAETAHTILKEAHTLLHERAGKISDEYLRDCFLNKVAVNREIEQAWQQA
jgi:class 3 adenylate cyclase/predicted ATPase